jgi:hypothetical protein
LQDDGWRVMRGGWPPRARALGQTLPSASARAAFLSACNIDQAVAADFGQLRQQPARTAIEGCLLFRPQVQQRCRLTELMKFLDRLLKKLATVSEIILLDVVAVSGRSGNAEVVYCIFFCYRVGKPPWVNPCDEPVRIVGAAPETARNDFWNTGRLVAMQQVTQPRGCPRSHGKDRQQLRR